MAKNGQNAMDLAHTKCLKHPKNVSTNTLKLFYAKNGWKKHLVFEKGEHSENGPKCPQCKGYSPHKIFSLGQKVKLLNTREKRLYKHIKVVLYKKQLKQTAIIRKMRVF